MPAERQDYGLVLVGEGWPSTCALDELVLQCPSVLGRFYHPLRTSLG